ncbi:2Fe-2S iron-sulfur cluster-binding protein [Streptomyces fructofermentans]|uniref:2Fe-2S ferredoxin-type domain-containing protein n=1 Tax=Streptomyces fructofermentans TaxID=152141 RepID=A0A918NVC0_9ACTN|nr:2Fe-2S iron-sulfur cluster-binding protein [Streptomyces fructofermentans]GGX97784.1 hypothetical protein GCM10010515_75210 [Streptomyces fructofermentans]
MTDDQHDDRPPQGGGRWDPLPQGDYDDGATAFVKLPEGGIDALLAAPGHGYVPPQITVAPTTNAGTDPASTGSWTMPAGVSDGAGRPSGADGRQDTGWPDPNARPEEHPGAAQDAFTYNPGSTGQWTFEQPPPGDGRDPSGQDVTGQWSIPVAGGDLPDESGEFSTSALAEQWGAAPPATLPGGGAAPWADEPWAQDPAPGQQPPEESGAPAGPEHGGPAAHGPAEPAGERADAPAGEDADGPREGGDEAPATAAQADDPGAAPHDDHPLASYVLRVNGADRPVTDAWIGESLLYVLRERLGLAGAKDGCSQGECGACNVQVDGRLVASCLVPAVTAAGSEVRTVEGLAADGQPSDVQRALAKCGAVQCGFCVPGMAMTVHDLLEGNPAPTELETRQALCGNLCRCSGYRGVLDAVREVVAERDAHAAAESDADEARIPHQAGPGGGGVNPSAFDPAQRYEQYGPDGGQA